MAQADQQVEWSKSNTPLYRALELIIDKFNYSLKQPYKISQVLYKKQVQYVPAKMPEEP